MTIVVTGARGFIGSHLVSALSSSDVRTVRHDAFSPSLFADASVVFHLAGPYRGSPALMEEAHVGMTAAVVAATPCTARLVYVSSTSVYGWDQEWPADESSPVAPSSAYGLCKAAAEEIVRSFRGEFVIVRPTIVYGPGDENGMLPRGLRLLRRGIRVFPGDGTNRVHLLHVDDCVAALVRVGLGPPPPSDLYVLSGPSPAPIASIFSTLAGDAGVPPPRWGLIPARVARRVAVGGALHSVEVATRDRAYSSARAASELGWSPVVSLPDGLASLGHSSSAAGFDWRGYFTDPDEGLGTVYERFGLDRILTAAASRTGATSVLHAPSFGMMGIPGLDAALQAQRGMRVGIAETDPERLSAVVGLWERLGLPVEAHLLPSDDPTTWPPSLGDNYDLVFSFAALWWFDDPLAVMRAQAGWARRSLVTCVPNKNVFMRMRAALWHRRLFEELNEAALDTSRLASLAPSLGMRVVESGLFDMPPFPDTSVPLARVLGRTGDTWSWSILPFLTGDAPDLPARIARLENFERHFPRLLAPAWAHHRYLVMERSSQIR